MDGSATKMKPFTPKPLSELLPGLSGILSKDSMRALTEMKQPRNTMGITHTSKKAVKPLTLAEMRTHLLALNDDSVKGQPNNSIKKKSGWNSSVKVDRTISHTANGQLKNHSVRKVLNFQTKPKTNVRATVNSETPKFPKPEVKAKKAFNVQAKNNIRISGVYKIPETPAIKRNPVYKSRMTLANKENVLHQNNTVQKISDTPKKKLLLQKKVTSVPDTPLSNMSWKSSGDASFLQVEKDIEEKTIASHDNIIQNVKETAQQVSTPFKEYRNFQEFFNNTNDTENSLHYNDNTIMCFDKLKISNENSKREENVIVSLCNMFDRATVNNCEKGSTEYKELLQHVEKQMVHNIEMIDNEINTLTKIKKSQLESLQIVRKLINDKHSVQLKSENEHRKEHETELKKDSLKVEINLTPNTSKACSVIKSTSKSPSYKIPKKNLCLRKKVFHKSMPNVSNSIQTPTKDTSNRALDIYMVMKEQMNFLNTPLVKSNRIQPQSTPAVTSQNLQMQLDKLYNGS